MGVEYWKEAVECAFDTADAYDVWNGLTDKQRSLIADSLQGSYECYGMAHYSPPPSDRLNEIQREADAKIKSLQREFDAYRQDAETAVKRALRQHSDVSVRIGKHGEVVRYDGRTTVIQ